MATRTKWQIAAIAEAYEKKYNVPLLQQVVSDMTTLMGKLITGKETGLCKLLTYRILPQEERGESLYTHTYLCGVICVQTETRALSLYALRSD